METINKGQIYFIAELSCNHHGSLDEALELVRLAHKSGADAVKTQTYTGDTITLKCNNSHFKLSNTKWDDYETLWNLFNSAHMPWEWNFPIKRETERLGMDFFSSPFDESAVDHLEEVGVDMYKVASMEIIDIPLLKRIGKTRKPVIVSTGMATLEEITEAVNILKSAGTKDIILLKCTSAYPAEIADANLNTMLHLKDTFNVPVGLSDHTKGIIVPVTACIMGAQVIEKHFTRDRSLGGPDSAFSLEPAEFKEMVDNVKLSNLAKGNVKYGGVKGEVRLFRRSLFVTENVSAGDVLVYGQNFRSIRPGDGLHTRHADNVNGRHAADDIEAGTPLSWELIN